jgi:hypothetical protein
VKNLLEKQIVQYGREVVYPQVVPEIHPKEEDKIEYHLDFYFFQLTIIIQIKFIAVDLYRTSYSQF